MKLLSVILSFFVKLGELLSSFCGWFVMLIMIAFNFLVDYKIAFIAVITCIMIDMIVGIWSALKQKKYAKSELMRDTFSKLFTYCGALITIIFMEKLIGIEILITTNICAAIICATELWSIAGNALIINPNLHFFKFVKFALVGEIARKLHIGEEDVKAKFENGELHLIIPKEQEKLVNKKSKAIE